MTIELGDDAATLRIPLHGNVIGHGIAADDGGASMDTFTTHIALDGKGGIQHGLHFRFIVIGGLHLQVLLHGLFDGDAQLVRDHLRDALTQ
jgi:hypothetical protein